MKDSKFIDVMEVVIEKDTNIVKLIGKPYLINGDYIELVRKLYGDLKMSETTSMPATVFKVNIEGSYDYTQVISDTLEASWKDLIGD